MEILKHALKICEAQIQKGETYKSQNVVKWRERTQTTEGRKGKEAES